MKKQINIVISGLSNTGKSTLQLQIVKHLRSIGVNAKAIISPDLTKEGVFERTVNPKKFIDDNIDVIVSETQINRQVKQKEKL